MSIFKKLDASETREKTTSFSQYAGIIKKADSFDPLPQTDDVIEYQYDINKIVWNLAVELRKTGDILSLGTRITCPVMAIHGDYDPHPAAGVRTPLSQMVKNFRFILLENCGHRPWAEKQARSRLYNILTKELR